MCHGSFISTFTISLPKLRLLKIKSCLATKHPRKQDSKEAYLIGLKRKGSVTLASIEGVSRAKTKVSAGEAEKS